VKALRHVISPRVSFSYTPDFSDPKWGYVDSFQDSTGEEITYSRLIERVSGAESKSMNFSVENLFQMKTADGEKEKKFDLCAINTSTGYNFKAEKQKWRTLSTSFRSSVVRNFNLNMNMSHSLYRYENNKTTNKIMLMEDKPFLKRQWLRLTNFRLSTNMRLQGQKKKGRNTDRQEQSAFDDSEEVLVTDDGEVIAKDQYYDQLNTAGGDRFDPQSQYSGLDIPWRTSLALEYSVSKPNPSIKNETYYLSLRNTELQLTNNWRINYSARFDIKDRKIVTHSFTFYRDLHCWEARFDWRPSGTGAPYFWLKINVRSSQLRDLKYEKRSNNSVLGYR
jgi:hypothetical protein